MTSPSAGDLVCWSDGSYGQIEAVGKALRWPHKVHVCNRLGSAFLGLLEGNKEPYVSISGGPFSSIDRSELEPMMELRRARFWNWGDCMPSAELGVEYWLARPVFKIDRLPPP